MTNEKSCDNLFEERIERDRLKVVIIHTDELGEPKFAVCKDEDNSFWLDTFDTIDEAKAWCLRGKYEIVESFCNIRGCKCE